MARRKLSQTRRDKSTLLQAWFNPAIPEEAEVLNALRLLQGKHPELTNKAIIAYSVMYTAEKDGIEIQLPVSGTQIMKALKKILSKMDGLVAGGHMSQHDAAAFVGLAESAGVRFEDLDPISRSVANNYTGFDFDEDEE
jgi:hypothetical protein